MNNRYADIIAFWGDTLRRVPADETLEDLLSNESYNFLKDVGLPNEEKLLEKRGQYIRSIIRTKTMRIDENFLRSTQPYFIFDTSPLKLLSFQGDKYLLLGIQVMHRIVLKVATDEVYLLRDVTLPKHSMDTSAQDLRFLNSSIGSCIQFLMVQLEAEEQTIAPTVRYNRLTISQIQAPSDDTKRELEQASEEITRAINDMVEKWKQIDPRATNDLQSWWMFIYLNELKIYKTGYKHEEIDGFEDNGS